MLDAEKLDVVLKVIQLIGIPVAIVIYLLDKRRERQDREYGTYNALDDKYIDYVSLCLQHPDLDVGDVPFHRSTPLTPAEQHRETHILLILVSLMERSFLMYRDKSERVRDEQWTGWESYIRDWCQRPNFVQVYKYAREDFDDGFVRYMDAQVGST